MLVLFCYVCCWIFFRSVDLLLERQSILLVCCSVDSDILLGLMKRLVKLRSSNLKVLITSATLDGVKVSKFFSGCPILNIPGTLFPVEKLYSKERPTTYVESSLKAALGMKKLFTYSSDLLCYSTFQLW